MRQNNLYDVIVIGSGVAGSMMAAILARNGASVMLLDQSAHPKFAIGESTIPNMLVSLRTMAERYGVPELKTLSTFQSCQRIVGPHNGAKTNFGFLTHQEGAPQDPSQLVMYSFPKLLHPTAQFYRQDIDAYLFHAALMYGCHARQKFRTATVDVDGSGVTVASADGEAYRARYVVDASGYRSVIARSQQLREDPCHYRHHSRAIWNHMVNVPVTDEVFARRESDCPPDRWYNGTVHHLFERGWYWVIPFDNDPSSTNPLCSVGLVLDPRRYPRDPNVSPEEEFWSHVSRYPDLIRQFHGARAVREWVGTDRLQYSSARTVGDRWVLLAHSAAFIDPLFSRGMANACETVNVLAWRILRAIRDDDFSAARFSHVELLQQALLEGNDKLVNASFISFENYALWSAVFRVWAWGSNAGTFRAHEAYRLWRKDGDERHLLELENVDNPGLHWSDHAGYAQLFEDMVRQCDDFEAGKVTGEDAAANLYGHLAAAPFVPKYFGWDEPDLRFLHPTPARMGKMIWWAAREAPPDVRRLTVGFFTEAMKEMAKGRRII